MLPISEPQPENPPKLSGSGCGGGAGCPPPHGLLLAAFPLPQEPLEVGMQCPGGTPDMPVPHPSCGLLFSPWLGENLEGKIKEENCFTLCATSAHSTKKCLFQAPRGFASNLAWSCRCSWAGRGVSGEHWCWCAGMQVCAGHRHRRGLGAAWWSHLGLVLCPVCGRDPASAFTPPQQVSWRGTDGHMPLVRWGKQDALAAPGTALLLPAAPTTVCWLGQIGCLPDGLKLWSLMRRSP